MPAPTLLVPGNLINPPPHEAAKIMGIPESEVVPIEYIKFWLKRKMYEYGGQSPENMRDRILIIRSMTGSGKSTTMPTSIYRVLSSNILKGKNIIVTEPRIVSAVKIAQEQRDAPFNKDISKFIGYRTGPLKESPRRGLIYATIGVLLAQLKTMTDAEIMEKYKVIIIDEAHERSLDIDTVFVKLKKLFLRNLGNRELPFLIVTSATFDVKKYAKYFGVGGDNIIEVTGRAYPVITHWPSVGTNDYLRTSAETAIKIHKEHLDDPLGKSDILIFSPGSGEAKKISLILDKANAPFRSVNSKIPPYIVLVVDAPTVAAEGRDYQLLGMDPNKILISASDSKEEKLVPLRRIIIATNAVETGVTIESLKYVIDSGWNRASESYYPHGFKGLLTRPCPKSRITQRKGRAGRLFPGEFYPTYTENSFKSLPEDQLPELITEGPGRIFLDIIISSSNSVEGKESKFRIEKLDMLDLPSPDAFHYSANQAISMGMLNRQWEVTPLGKLVSRFTRIDLFEARIIFLGYYWGVAIYDLVNIVSMFGRRRRDFVKGNDSAPWKDILSEANNMMTELGVEAFSIFLSCELIEFGILLQGFIEKLSRGLPEALEWCEKQSIKFDGFMNALNRREEIINDLTANGIDLWHGYDTSLFNEKHGASNWFKTICNIKQCLYDGLRDNILHERGGVYYNKGKKIEVPNHINGKLLVASMIKLDPVRSKDPREAGPLVYKLVAYGVSVMDGYVNFIDESLLLPRQL